ncbi:hypothetical protein BN6_29420 [Saccharothrix espanaensis DSM 44229]|uniref:HTH araC/xylS-type domain-containing protein n=1 Tax=Saccharothrix espanaensis (strain ATCC 51144 / DSM 44229 / JCM 9112 / NBRC 15066 / NRRL 15764) TaxID=1179773 RepID=K0JY33_SACES|nr:hypothetical protein BN6_29420 [Saccharothrix espanaensis DSM 44229]
MTGVALPETCSSRSCATIWVGQGRAAYFGPSLRLREHSGSVHCFALGVDEPFTIVCGGNERLVRSALIPPRTRHRLIAENGRMVFAYLDPGSPWVARTGGRMTGRVGPVILSDHEDDQRLAAGLRAAASPDPLSLLEIGDHADQRDERIRAALALLRTERGGSLSVAQLADAVNLSASRFQHLFTAHTGTSFRRYRLWARMLHVARATRAGKDLTTAAIEAGFASSAHFSDSFRAMFGLSARRLAVGAVLVPDRP